MPSHRMRKERWNSLVDEVEGAGMKTGFKILR